MYVKGEIRNSVGSAIPVNTSWEKNQHRFLVFIVLIVRYFFI